MSSPFFFAPWLLTSTRTQLANSNLSNRRLLGDRGSFVCGRNSLLESHPSLFVTGAPNLPTGLNEFLFHRVRYRFLMDLIEPTDRLSCFVFYLFCQGIPHRSSSFDLAPQARRYLDTGRKGALQTRRRNSLRNHMRDKRLVQGEQVS